MVAMTLWADKDRPYFSPIHPEKPTVLSAVWSLPLLTNAVTIKLTKLECSAYDKSFIIFKSCYLKVLGRNKVSGNIYVRLLKPPVDNITVNAGFYVKSSSQKYNPFLYNTTFNFCSFVKNPNRFIFWKILITYVYDYSNVNHSCPYNHDLIVSDFVLSPDMLKYIPFPSGDYLVKVRAAITKDYKGEVLAYFNIKE
ncbi:uncharacterized protein LOC135951995 [Calliphora vicina]|uniref:uncharacterized protein LOC135951995 n=1 Tax=Calliphora vicina TaxID=7373 RepID=UPI00325BAE7E